MRGFVERYLAFLRRRNLVIATVGFALFVAGIGASLRLQLHTDLADLLPSDDPAVLELRRIADRVPAPATLVIAVESDDPRANERFADALAPKLERLVGTDLRAVDWRADAAHAFYEHNRVLYASLADLHRIDEDLASVLLSKKNPAFVPLDDPEADLDQLKQELEDRARDADHFPSGYFEGEDGHLLAIITWTDSSGTGDASGFRIRDEVRRLVAETDPAAFGVKASLTGDVESAIEEHDALKADIAMVSVLCAVLVLLVIIFYFGNLSAIPFIFFPTLLGVAIAFGVTGLTIGSLNTNTAFLGSIILGNGINFGIILLARYQEERAAGADTEAAVATAIRETAGATLVAALAAGIAYGSLAITRFRGFQQFGFVGGLGMVACWLATYSLGPALLLLWRPRRPPRATATFPPRFAARLFRRPVLTLVLTGAGLLAAGTAVARIIESPFDYDFRKLRNQSSERHGAGLLYRRVGRMFPSNITPYAVALVPRPEDAPRFRTALLEKDCAVSEHRRRTPLARDANELGLECARRIAAGEPTGGMLQDVRTAWSLLPTEQEPKLAVVAHIRTLLDDPAIALLDDDERAQVDHWKPPADLRAVTLADLPDSLVRPYREVDGTIGRVALVYPVTAGFQGWDGRVLLRMYDLTHRVPLPDGTVVSAAGHGSLFAAMLRAILRDGPRASLAAFVGVLLLVALFFRRVQAAGLVVGSLVIGVVWMGGVAAALGLRLNFLNFVAVPVTLGIGVDYAVNIYARLAREDRAVWPRALARTGSAVALCSSTTIIGYSTLLIANNGALRSFGALADLGEVACLLAGLLVVPAVLSMQHDDVGSRTGVGSSPPGPAGGISDS